MKRIVNGKRYDTETATLIDSYHNGLARSDFNYVNEALYVTKKGAFFQAGEGGARTIYAYKHADGMSSGAKKLFPMDQDEALDWCERRGTDTETIERYFNIKSA